MQGIVFDLGDTLCDYQAAKMSASKLIDAVLVKRNIDTAKFCGQ